MTSSTLFASIFWISYTEIAPCNDIEISNLHKSKIIDTIRKIIKKYTKNIYIYISDCK